MAISQASIKFNKITTISTKQANSLSPLFFFITCQHTHVRITSSRLRWRSAPQPPNYSLLALLLVSLPFAVWVPLPLSSRYSSYYPYLSPSVFLRRLLLLVPGPPPILLPPTYSIFLYLLPSPYLPLPTIIQSRDLAHSGYICVSIPPASSYLPHRVSSSGLTFFHLSSCRCLMLGWSVISRASSLCRYYGDKASQFLHQMNIPLGWYLA